MRIYQNQTFSPTNGQDVGIDENTFDGLKQIQQAVAQDDPYKIQFTQDLTWIVCIELPYIIVDLAQDFFL